MNIMYRCDALLRLFVAMTASALLMSAIASPATAQTVNWQTIIGIVEPGNKVGNITGAGAPWTVLNGHAGVNLSAGNLQFQVHGLVLAGGNDIGTTRAVTQVKGTLICDAGNTNVTIDAPLVPLDSQGNANFSGNVGPIPTTCTSSNIAFLIRIPSTPTNRWIANGSVRN